MRVRASAVLVREMLLKIKFPKDLLVEVEQKMKGLKVKSQKQADSDRLKSFKTVH